MALRRAWPLAVGLIFLIVAVMSLACSRHGRPAFTSALLMPDMLVNMPVRPVTWFTATPVVERTFIDYEGGRILADIYRPPDNGGHAGLIFSMGAPPLYLDDPRLVKLAEDLARAGLVVVVPFSARLDEEMIEPEEVEALVGVFLHLERQPYVDAERVGYFGISVGGSLALLAAADSRIADRVDYVVSFGGYFDALDTFTAVAANRLVYDGQEEAWEPDTHTVEVVALQIIAELSDPGDRETLCRVFVVDRSGREALCDAAFIDYRPVTSADISELTSEGRVAYEFMTSGDLARAQELARRLPASALMRLDALSPRGVIDRLQAELFIIHDRGDAFVPYVESRRLRDALAEHEKTHFTEVSLFEHVEPRLGRGGDILVLDSARLYFRLYQLLLKLL